MSSFPSAQIAGRLRAAGLVVLALAGVGLVGATAWQSWGPPPVQPVATPTAELLADDGATAFDETDPGVANLDPALLAAVRNAAADAADDGVTFHVTSGWRSPELQDRLFTEAVAEYGSVEEAARWVATAETSVHVSGDAVDVGELDAMLWLSEHGAAYGLCQVYANERWHYELRPDAVDDGCPTMYDDPTHDPRMQ